jgi:hypothetical protein
MGSVFKLRQTEGQIDGNCGRVGSGKQGVLAQVGITLGRLDLRVAEDVLDFV